MRNFANPLLWATALVMALRLIPMYSLPLTDTTEARYAAIAQLMVKTNDWITPWYTPDQPFWGKPPLAFWTEALGLKWLGSSEFAVRFSSWLATLAILALLYALAANWYGRRTAGLSVLIYASTALVFAANGAVMTDSFLALGVCWSLVGFALARADGLWFWRYSPFLGMATGLLSKGPLAGILIGVPFVAWALMDAQARARWRGLPWFSGVLLTVVLTVPWYIAAELKTPGFLYYFLWGEHVLRFLDPGWSGDMYGNGHASPKGMIWLFGLGATLPWGLLALVYLARSATQLPAVVKKQFEDQRTAFLWAWTLTTPLFFSAAGNILWTYVLPAIGPFAILLARRLSATTSATSQRFVYAAALLPGTVAVVLTALAAMGAIDLRSERDLVASAQAQGLNQTLLYVDRKPTYSARFYSGEQVAEIHQQDITGFLQQHPTAWLAIPRKSINKLRNNPNLTLEQRFENKRYILVQATLNDSQQQ